MDNPAQKQKAMPWDRLSAGEQAPYLREAREYVASDVHRPDQLDVSPDEFDEAVRQAAEEIYAEACERRAQEQETPHEHLSSEQGTRQSL